ncbi:MULTISPECIES: hypothetical protein [unclassified Rhizobium]|uniref:hypothetical protein n=1 Tax=unclassified Rhizobium TaxID=2613769 RepID=UPI003802EB6F
MQFPVLIVGHSDGKKRRQQGVKFKTGRRSEQVVKTSSPAMENESSVQAPVAAPSIEAASNQCIAGERDIKRLKALVKELSLADLQLRADPPRST